MVAIKSKSIDEISAMAEQRLPVPGADVAWLVGRVRELEGALSAAVEYMDFISTPTSEAFPLDRCRGVLLAKADQEDPV